MCIRDRGDPGRLAPASQAVAVADPGHAGRFRQQVHQVARVGNLEGSRGKPFRRLLAGALGECHGRQLYVGPGAVVPEGSAEASRKLLLRSEAGVW